MLLSECLLATLCGWLTFIEPFRSRLTPLRKLDVLSVLCSSLFGLAYLSLVTLLLLLASGGTLYLVLASRRSFAANTLCGTLCSSCCCLSLHHSTCRSNALGPNVLSQQGHCSVTPIVPTALRLRRVDTLGVAGMFVSLLADFIASTGSSCCSFHLLLEGCWEGWLCGCCCDCGCCL